MEDYTAGNAAGLLANIGMGRHFEALQVNDVNRAGLVAHAFNGNNSVADVR